MMVLTAIGLLAIAGPEPTPATAQEPARLAETLRSLSVGEMRGLKVLDQPEAASSKPFANAAGEYISLADFRGQVVLLNFWATWCPPCLAEMPSLDRLAAQMEASSLADEFTLLAVDLDPNAERAKRFLKENGIKNLPFYRDETMSFSFEMAVSAMPTSMFIDRGGRIVARFEGAAE